MTDDVDVRAALIDAAEAQLIASPDNDVTTRSVCEAAGVTQPVLYRVFGDKRGLLDALADRGLERYAAVKDAQPVTTDAVADLRLGWDSHMQFARANPALYQLMFAPRPWSQSGARERVFQLLVSTLVRCAAAGALTLEPDVAAQLMLSANVGVALNQIAQPALFHDATLSHRMRDAVLGYVLVPTASVEPTPDSSPVAAAAMRLRWQLTVSGSEVLLPAEQALLDLWLRRFEPARTG